MIMQLRSGLPNRFVVTGKLNPATEPGDAIATAAQATEITRLCKSIYIDGRRPRSRIRGDGTPSDVQNTHKKYFENTK